MHVKKKRKKTLFLSLFSLLSLLATEIVLPHTERLYHENLPWDDRRLSFLSFSMGVKTFCFFGSADLLTFSLTSLLLLLRRLKTGKRLGRSSGTISVCTLPSNKCHAITRQPRQ
jgi:hypothetical protein